jgi:hypothetical protein
MAGFDVKTHMLQSGDDATWTRHQGFKQTFFRELWTKLYTLQTKMFLMIRDQQNDSIYERRTAIKDTHIYIPTYTDKIPAETHS